MQTITLAHSELTKTIYAIIGKEKVDITDQAIAEVEAIKALEKEPKTDSDAISRQAVNTLVDELARAISDKRWDITRGRSTASIMQDILDLPPVTPTFPKGATNGNMILNMFDTATVYGIDKENDCITICIDNNFYQKFRYSWWNAPYESEVVNELGN